jgi:hypothetical protein
MGTWLILHGKSAFESAFWENIYTVGKMFTAALGDFR